MFIKEKKKQAEAMTVEVPQIKDDEVLVIQLDCKNKKQWKPLSDVILDGDARVNSIREHIKEKMGITKFEPAPFRLQREPSEHPSASRITIRLVLELADKPYDLSASSNASRITQRLVDVCSKGPRCVFIALNCVKLQRGSFEHTSASRITIRLALVLAGKPYDLPASSNAIPLTIRLANGCSEGPHCVFSALDCVKLQRKPSEHPSASHITICLALELAAKPYDLSASSNASRLTIRLGNGCSKCLRCVFSALDYVKLQRRPSKHPSASHITIWLALELADKPYDLSANSTASRITIRFADGCSSSEHPSTNRIIIRLALELFGKSYDLSASSNASRITKRILDGCSEGPLCIFSALYCVKLQREASEHTSASRITIRLALELTDKAYDLSTVTGKSYDLLASSNAIRITKRLADGCSKGLRYVFSALDYVKLQRGPFEHASASRITIRLALEFAGKPYDLSESSNPSRLTIRFADGCSKGSRCVFSALGCVKLQRRSSEHSSTSHITIRLALELFGKSYDLPASSNVSRITKRLVDGCSEGPLCIFSALDCVKLQREASEHTSASRITIRLALELTGKPYDLSAGFNASRLTIQLVDACAEGPHCVFSALNYVKSQRGPSKHSSASRMLQRGPFEHTSTSRITIRIVLELAGKPYDFSTSSNANRINKRFVDGCSEGSHCVFNALDCVKLQCGPFEHPSANRITIRLALELVAKSYDLPASSNAKRLTIQLAEGYSEGPRCVFSALDYVKSQSGPSKHSSASRITIRVALELAGKPYDLPASSNTIRITKRLADECSEGPRCVFNVLNCVKLQRGSFEHPSTSRITIRFALELIGKSYDLPPSYTAKRLTIRLADGCSKVTGKSYDLLASSNAIRITKRLADGCSKGLRYVFSTLDYVKLQRGSFEHASASRITIQLALEFAGKPYDLSESSNPSRLTIRFADGCSKGSRCVFSALDCVKLQRRSSEHSSTSHITIRLALELFGKSYDLPASSNVSRITKRLVDGCSEGPLCIFSALDCVKLQREASEHTSASRITIRLALELTGKPYDLSAGFNASRLTIQLVDACAEGPHCVFSALNYVKSQRGPSKHSSASRMCFTASSCNADLLSTHRQAVLSYGLPYDLSICRKSLMQAGLPYGLSMGARKVRLKRFSALEYVKLQRGPFEHPSASRITIRIALELGGKPYDLLARSNAIRITKRLADRCLEDPRYVFSALNCVKLQHGPFEHPSASRITIQLTLELTGNPYDLPTISTTSRLTIRFADGYSKGPRCVFSALDCVKLQCGSFEHPLASRITIRFALELAGKPYDLPASSSVRRLTIRLADGALNCVKLQRGPFEHTSTSRITIRIVLELAGKPYDFSTSSNANRINKRFVDGCSEGSHCVFNALDCVKLQCGPFEHPSANRITIRLALELVAKSYDLPASSNAKRLTIQLAEGYSEGPRCVFSALDYVKSQSGPSKHSSASRITIRVALELAGKPYDLPASSNTIRITKRLADECSEGPRCVFNVLNCVKLQRGSFEHPSTSRITIRFALELIGKPYDLPPSYTAKRLTIRLADGCSKGPRCIFNALNCLQRKSFEHPSASRITIRLALEFADKPYDLSASSNASRITKRLVDGCSKGSRCVFSTLDCVKLQRGPFEHPSASRITIRFALVLAGKPYDLPASSNAKPLTIRLANGCSEGPRCVFNDLDCVKLQRKPSEHPSASCITIRIALEFVSKPYDLSASSNASRITKRLGDGCSEAPRCVFNALDCVKLQRGTFEHPSASRITIRHALELASKPCELPASSTASRLTIRLANGCSKGLRCVFSALNYVKLQRESSKHTSASHMIC
ncbi:hypothetical protein L7F22_064511 [Adiantum nelumboides]|nr:hypothetical protein [Adiantum nelumboides]